MIKKIQQYLLIHYPLLWNIKIVPALIGAIIINLLFFCAGYFLFDLDFRNTYYYSANVNRGFIYFGAVITAVLSLIFWLISYSKNNAFKVFYPKTFRGLYAEWISIFVIALSFAMFPYSFNKGETQKLRSYATESEMIKAIEVLNMVDILIPEVKTNYYKEYPDEYDSGEPHVDYATPISPNEYSDVDNPTLVEEVTETLPATEISLDDAVTIAEQSNKTFNEFPDFRQLSLMNYESYSHLYISHRYDLKVSDYRTVKTWLMNQDKEKIVGLMDAFLNLQEKHGLKSNLTRDQWLHLVYNPKKYPVGDYNLINRFNINRYKENEYYYYPYANYDVPSGYYLQYEELVGGYNKIMDAYMDKEFNDVILLVPVCFAVIIALLIFSFRVTSGKSWLIALISIGLVMIIDLLMALVISSSQTYRDVDGLKLYIIILLLIFICEFIYLLNKIISKKSKGRSNTVLNHFMWFIPTVPILMFTLIYIISDDNCSYYNNSDSHCLYRYMSDHLVEFMWGNVCLTFVTVGLFIRFVLLKWKGLPEE